MTQFNLDRIVWTLLVLGRIKQMSLINHLYTSADPSSSIFRPLDGPLSPGLPCSNMKGKLMPRKEPRSCLRYSHPITGYTHCRDEFHKSIAVARFQEGKVTFLKKSHQFVLVVIVAEFQVGEVWWCTNVYNIYKYNIFIYLCILYKMYIQNEWNDNEDPIFLKQLQEKDW